MEDEIVWLRVDTVLALHDEQLAEHGGPVGVRDQGLLESALARPRTIASTQEQNIPSVAALYAIALIHNHPFVDGNKRVGAVALELALNLNGYHLNVTDVELVEAILSLAAGTSSDAGFTDWVREHSERIS